MLKLEYSFFISSFPASSGVEINFSGQCSLLFKKKSGPFHHNLLFLRSSTFGNRVGTLAGFWSLGTCLHFSCFDLFWISSLYKFYVLVRVTLALAVIRRTSKTFSLSIFFPLFPCMQQYLAINYWLTNRRDPAAALLSKHFFRYMTKSIYLYKKGILFFLN